MQYEVGQQVYVIRYSSWGENHFQEGKVVKVTPSGLVDVLIGASETPTRFDANGRERGESRAYGRYLDSDMPFSERTVFLAKRSVLRSAVAEFNKLKEGQHLNSNPSLESLKQSVSAAKEILSSVEKLISELEAK